MTGRRWASALALLALVRIGIALLTLARVRPPGTPRLEGHALSGDATGFYAAARDFIAAWARLPRPVLALLALATLAAAAALVVAWRRWPRHRAWLLAGALWWIGLLLVANVAVERFSGAAVIGWPIVWALPMLPLRAVGALDANVAFWLGVPIQLACNAVTVVATAYAALYATGRRAAGVVAGAAFAVWPLLTGAIAGHDAWANATWSIDVGLHSYGDPLSTALTAVALALLLSPRLTPLRLAAAGGALGYATAVRLSNAVLAAAAALLLAWRFRGELRRTLPFAAGGLAFAPLVLLYWPLGYARLNDIPGYWHPNTFSTDWLGRSWAGSLLWTPRTLAIVLPPALLGLAFVRREWPRALLVVWLLAAPLFYSVYWYTAIHPRFLWTSLPPLFALWSAAAVAVGDAAARRLPRPTARGVPRAGPRSP